MCTVYVGFGIATIHDTRSTSLNYSFETDSTKPTDRSHTILVLRLQERCETRQAFLQGGHAHLCEDEAEVARPVEAAIAAGHDEDAGRVKHLRVQRFLSGPA